uniref:YTH domain-containing family protein n=1 Tax=Oryza glumipatula TaxID=40148 RepID=A0A0E0AZC6_9ORYZ
MKEPSDPPMSALSHTEGDSSGFTRNNDRNDDAVGGEDSTSSYQPCNSMKCKDGTQIMSLANEDVSNLASDCQEPPSESNHAISHGSNTDSKEEMSSGSGYRRQQSCFSSSTCSWRSSSEVESVSSTPDRSGDVVGNMSVRSKTFERRPDHIASYPSASPDIRRLHAAEGKADFTLDYHSEERWSRRSNQSTAFRTSNGQSIEHHSEIVDIPRQANSMDETTSSSSQWSFDNWGPSLPRGMQYGDEIPSLSSQNYGARIPSLSSRQSYGDEIPSLSRNCNYASRQSYGDEIPSLSSRHCNSFSSRQSYGDEIPSLSRHCNARSSRQNYGDEIPSLSNSDYQCYQDRIPLHHRQWCHDAEAHPQLNYGRGASHGNRYSRDSFVSSIATNQRFKMGTGKHTVTRSDHHRTIKNDNVCKHSDDTLEQVRGPRANKLENATRSKTQEDIRSPLVRRDQFNRPDFIVEYEQAKFFMIKSYSEDDIHKGIKYNVWASTPHGNNKLDAAFREAQILIKEKGKKCPVFLFFSVNSSGQFVGLAEILGPVDFKKTMDFWKLDRWNGFFPVTWHIIKDIPNRLFKHITLENNDNRIVTFSRDTQEIGLLQGLKMLKIFKDYDQETSLLDDFNFYEEKENARCAKKGINAESTHEARLLFFGTGARHSDDFKSMENLEASMENTILY